MKTAFKWTRRILGGLLLILLLLLGTVYTVSSVKMSKSYRIRSEKLSIPSDALAIERGRHLVFAISKCIDCHGRDLAGAKVIDEPGIGTLWGTNLTRGKGGIGAKYTDEDWVRAIRHGVRRDGSALIVMPSQEFWPHDDDDLAAIIAYVKSVPPVDRVVPERSVGPLIRGLYLIGQVALVPAELIDHNAPRPAAPKPAATAEYGRHLAATGGCLTCHGPGLSGGQIPGTPPEWPHARNLTPDRATGIGDWNQADFFRALREGKRPSGDTLRAPMPWKATAMMSDMEIEALWLYLRTVPAQKAGNR
jgi:cytochrome c553